MEFMPERGRKCLAMAKLTDSPGKGKHRDSMHLLQVAGCSHSYRLAVVKDLKSISKN